MPNISEIARDWGCDRSWVSRCVNKRGCPTDSLEAAREWRECYASSRPSVARAIKGQEYRNKPLISLADARDMAWRHYDEILDLVMGLPERVAAQCNPPDPQLALTVLDAACASIHWAAYEMYTAWSKVGPHLSTATDPE